MTGFLSLFSSLPLPKLTQNESVSQTENEEHILEGEDGEGKHGQTSLNILSKER